ncbi:MAG: hypothetical protein GTO05_00140 [Gemmatimonadales bacterium]|nr:hypothetical protein [Gemmatimonadales bacterium]NIN10028.1 hypothetical protein [Gemmatimonadales bacterium]NIS63557.1 hypothetical protein [Gemmatimonadales bacterium]
MDAAEYTIILVNLGLAAGCTFPVARLLARAGGNRRRVRRYCAMLIGVYVAEAVAFSAGMATNVFSVGLAVVWGTALGRWLRHSESPEREMLKTALCFSLYSCLPAISFLSVFLLVALAGWPILSADAGARFGVPAFVPWPANTLLGFFGIVIGSAVVLKTVITTGEVHLLIHRGRGRRQ